MRVYKGRMRNYEFCFFIQQRVQISLNAINQFG